MLLKFKFSAGELFTLSRAAIWAGKKINHKFDTLTQEQRAIDSSRRIFNIIDYPVDIKDEKNDDDIDDNEYEYRMNEIEKSFKGKVEFKHVWFKYPTRDSWILKDVSFETEPGKATAIVGHSGSGKSTIVQLLLRFYDVDQGEILLDGINIKEYRLSFLHHAIGVVQQDPALFSLYIRDNIAYSKPNAIDEEILNASKVANAANFISKLPNKFNTLCGEKGTFLSGG